jgi:5-methyltetrahydrofolate--homocysteine methyltransferase
VETILKGTSLEIIVGPQRPTVLIGNRIDAAKQGPLAEAIRRMDLTRIQHEARAQVDEGAGVIAIQVCADGIDQERVLPAVVQAVSQVVPVPLCINTENPKALAAALQVCPGKPLVGSISGKPIVLRELLPLAVQHRAAVMGLALDNVGIPKVFDERIELMRTVLRAILVSGVPRQDIILNPGLLPVAEHRDAVLVSLRAVAHLARVEQLNLALEPACAAQEMDDADSVGEILLALGVHAGVTCAIGDPGRCDKAVRTADLLLCQSGAI